jgi:CHASE3 domain sensor protein
MIVIIFVALAIVYYLVQHLENRRRDRNEQQQERRKNAYLNLLHSIKDKEESKDTQNNKENET